MRARLLLNKWEVEVLDKEPKFVDVTILHPKRRAGLTDVLRRGVLLVKSRRGRPVAVNPTALEPLDDRAAELLSAVRAATAFDPRLKAAFDLPGPRPSDMGVVEADHKQFKSVRS